MSTRTLTIPIQPMHIPSIAVPFTQKHDIIKGYAERYVRGGKDHETLKEAAEQTALDCVGIDTPSEVKKLFRFYVRQLSKLAGN